VTDGTHDTPKPTKEGQFLITSRHIKYGHIDFSDAYLISEEDFCDANKRSKVDSFDVLFSMIGTIGEIAVVDKEYPEFAIKNVGLFKVGGNKTLAYWLNYYFKSKYAKRYIHNNLKGTTQRYMPLFALRDFPVVNPPIEERVRIINIINATVQRLEFLRKKKIGLGRIKKGLMNDLLTGKKRVAV
jgi:type I restriction enzyme S subunit